MTSQMFLLLLSSLSLGSCWDGPAFCYGDKCPDFTTVATYQAFEERFYKASQWITTTIEGTKELQIAEGFWKLHSFMEGENNKDQEFARTRPVVVSVIETKETRQVSISFFISSDPDMDVPQPNDATITIKELPAATVYVRVFDGIDVQDAFHNAEILRNELVAEGKVFNATTFHGAVYDPPLVLVNRHNEVWIYAN